MNNGNEKSAGSTSPPPLQPHHTTIHFNGWARDAANPRGFTTNNDFHSRFESAFVSAHITYEDIAPRMAQAPKTLENVRAAIWAHVAESNSTVERQYQLEKEFSFDPDAPAAPELTEFVAERLTAGAEMLRALWWSAWLESEALAAERRARGWNQ